MLNHLVDEFDAARAPGVARTQIPPSVPTPAEIALECERIQASWSEAEHHRRAGCLAPRSVELVETRPLFDHVAEDHDA